MRLLERLDDAQREAVTTDAAPLCILAGAGSGKTRVLTHRVAHRVQAGTAGPEHVLVVTFTRKAAGELARRLAGLGVRDRVAAGTFHALALAQLQHWWGARRKAPPAVLANKRPFLERLGVPPGLAGEIEWAKARMLGPGQHPDAAVNEAYARYEQEKRRRGVVDFDDLLSMCAQALEDDAGFAAAQRWRFRHLFVDEFQDVNPAQFRLLRAWLGDRDDLCVVGDPNQAIYGWNGADPSLLDRFCGHFPGASVVRLDANYRSTPQIVAAAASVLPGGRPPRAAGQAEGPVPTLTACGSEADEAAWVARRLRRAHRPGVPWSHLAVLARTNAQLEPIARALAAAGIPHHRAGQRPLTRTSGMGEALALLRAAPGVSRLASHVYDLAEVPGADELVALAREYAALEPEATVAAFLTWLPVAAAGEGDGPGDAVQLTTFHRAKGLEWDTVFVVGLEDGLVPIGGAAPGSAAMAEERRLLYVAMTRAVRELHCSWAERRVVGGRTVARARSPFLGEVEAACRRLDDPGEPADWRDRFAAERARLADLEPVIAAR